MKTFAEKNYEQRQAVLAEKAAQVEQVLIEAAHTLRRLPDLELGYLAAAGRSNAPEYVHEPWDRMWAEAERAKNGDFDLPRWPAPTKAECSAWEASLDLLGVLDKRTKTVVFMGALDQDGEKKDRIRWRKVKNKVPELAAICSKRLRGIYNSGLERIALSQM